MSGVAVVTGANRGIGLETSRQLLDRGMRVVMTGRDERATERALRSLGDTRGEAIAARMDVTDPVSVSAAYRTIVDRFGTVDVLVNNAAVLLFEDADVLSIPQDGFRQTFETNLFGVIEVCRVFVPPMATRGYGRIVNVSSGAGQLASMSTYAPAYSISKAALNAFTRILAATYAGRGVLARPIRVGSAPTWVVPPRPDRCRRGPTRSCGLPRYPTMDRRAAFSRTDGPSSGDRRSTDGSLIRTSSSEASPQTVKRLRLARRKLDNAALTPTPARQERAPGTPGRADGLDRKLDSKAQNGTGQGLWVSIRVAYVPGTGATHDSQTRVRAVSTVFAEARPKDRKAAQPRYIQVARSGGTARARRSVLQTAGVNEN
jgi:NAD(P)-dependent dehydrogenase (short-subunit alcohol dehydrogenase family)